MLKSELIAQKKGEKIAQDLSAKNLSSVDAYAQAMNSSADSVKFVSFATRRIAGIGVEPKLNAMVSVLVSRLFSHWLTKLMWKITVSVFIDR